MNWAAPNLATFENPHRVPAGLAHALVNGVAVLRDGKHKEPCPDEVYDVSRLAAFATR